MFEGTQYMTVFFDDSDCALHKKNEQENLKETKTWKEKQAAKKT